jgi:methionyl-tRNA formyltransferase
MFVVDREADAGPIIASRSFYLSDTDTISDSYRKAEEVELQMVQSLLLEKKKFIEEFAARKPQSPPFFYLPKRLEQDGEIDWRQSSQKIHNLVRATTTPFPLAFSYTNCGIKVKFLASRESSSKPKNVAPGTVLQLHNGTWTIATGNGALDLVTEGVGLQVGLVLQSSTHSLVGEQICSRHRKSNPTKPISPIVLDHYQLAHEDLCID